MILDDQHAGGGCHAAEIHGGCGLRKYDFRNMAGTGTIMVLIVFKRLMVIMQMTGMGAARRTARNAGFLCRFRLSQFADRSHSMCPADGARLQ